MIFTIISILILFYGCFRYKKGLMFFVIFQIFWYSTPVFSVSGFSLNTSVLLTTGYVALYYLKRKKIEKSSQKFPFSIPFILIILSYVLTSFFALSGFTTEFSRSLTYILKDYILVWLLWRTLDTEKDFNFLFRGITFVIFICCIYGIFEYILESNPLFEYKIELSGNTIVTYDNSGLRGYRLNSLFEHPIGAGMTLGLYSMFVLTLWQKKQFIPQKYFSLFVALLCIPCVMLTKMRTSILFTIICMFAFVSFKAFKKKKFIILLGVLLLSIPIILLIMGDNANILFNLFTVNTSTEIGGSSFDMRITQLDAIVQIIKSSPIFGLGETFRSFIVRSAYTDAALGFEGVWFEKLVMHGMTGIIVNLILVYFTAFKIPKKYKSKPACIFALSYWIAYTFSSIPSFRTFLFFLIQFYFIKTSDIYKIQEKNENLLD